MRVAWFSLVVMVRLAIAVALAVGGVAFISGTVDLGSMLFNALALEETESENSAIS